MVKRDSRPYGDEGDEEQPSLPIFRSEPSTADATEVTGTAQEEKEHNKPMASNDLYARLFVGKAAAWTAIFTCFLVIFSGLLWKVASDANDSSVVNQRAFASGTSPQLTKQIANGKLTGVNVTALIINSGNTPAKSGISESNIYVGVEEPRDGLNFDNLPQAQRNQFVLGPHGVLQLQPVPLSNGDMESLADNKTHVFYWGWATYHDIFPGTPVRLTEWCYSFNNPIWSKPDHTDTTTDVTSVNTPTCSTHNCYDEDCADYKERTK